MYDVHKKYFRFLRYVVFSIPILALCAMYTKAQHGKRHADALVTKAVHAPAVAVACRKECCYFVVFLNGEPIGYNSGYTGVMWQGYPLHVGKNNVKVIVNNMLPKSNSFSQDEMTIAWYDGQHIDEGYQDIALPKSGQLETNVEFLVAGNYQASTPPDELLPKEKAMIEKKLRDFTMRFLKYLMKRDAEGIEKLMPSRTFKEWLTKLPAWYTDRSNTNTMFHCVHDELDDITILQGARYYLVIPSREYINRSDCASLFEASSSSSDVTLTINCLLFDRRNGHWEISQNGQLNCPIKF